MDQLRYVCVPYHPSTSVSENIAPTLKFQWLSHLRLSQNRLTVICRFAITEQSQRDENSTLFWEAEATRDAEIWYIIPSMLKAKTEQNFCLVQLPPSLGKGWCNKNLWPFFYTRDGLLTSRSHLMRWGNLHVAPLKASWLAMAAKGEEAIKSRLGLARSIVSSAASQK